MPDSGALPLRRLGGGALGRLAGNHGPIALGVGGFTIGVGAWLAPKALAFLLFRRRPVYPMRWRLPLPLPSRRARPTFRVEGPLEPRGELLEAPLSGRPCVGYEVRALFDAAGDARPPMWILEEERAAPFAVDGHEVPADGATLQIQTRALDDEQPELEEARITTFLRKRGLFAAEGAYTLTRPSSSRVAPTGSSEPTTPPAPYPAWWTPTERRSGGLSRHPTAEPHPSWAIPTPPTPTPPRGQRPWPRLCTRGRGGCIRPDCDYCYC